MTTRDELSKLKLQVRKYRAANAELRETLRAIQSGEVDALVVHGPLGDRIFTLHSAEQPYRELVEAMNEGALTVTPEGILLYCNTRFENMVASPPEKLIGSDIRAHVRPESRLALEGLLQRAKMAPSSVEVALNVMGKGPLPVQLSISAIKLVGTVGFCIVATDLSAQKQNAEAVEEQEWLSVLLNRLPVPLVMLTPENHQFTLINAHANRILGRTSASGGVESSNPLVFENDSGQMFSLPALLHKTDKAGTEGFEAVLSTKERKIPVLLFSEILPAMHNREAARLLIFEEVSNLKRAQQ